MSDDGTAGCVDSSADTLAALSKNQRKRLLKLEQKESRKQKRKEEKRMRKLQRVERNAASEANAAVSASGDGCAGTSEGAVGSLAEEPNGCMVRSPAEHRAAAQATWRRLGCPRLVLAPMVNQSELAFRLLARKHGAALCYTPMLHSTRFVSEEGYRIENFDDHPADRPLVAQFCGDDPATLLAAARLIQDRCDAVDLNCGCPQGVPSACVERSSSACACDPGATVPHRALAGARRYRTPRSLRCLPP